jgi:hypothetical protein
MANPTSNFGWQMPTSTDLVTDLPADFAVFGQAVDTSLADLKGGTTGQVLKKNTNTDMDFVWAADSAGMTNPMTTTGDSIYSSSGSTPARLGIGTTGQVLTVSGGLPAWATPASGLTKISSNAFSNVASVTIDGCFTSTYTDYLVIINSIYAGTQTDDILMQLRYGSTTETAATYYGASYAVPYTGANTTIQNNGTTSFQISNNIGTATYSSTGQIFFSRIGNSNQASSWRGQLMDEGDSVAVHFAGKSNTARTYTGLVFKSSSTNITGNITIYGLAN